MQNRTFGFGLSIEQNQHKLPFRGQSRQLTMIQIQITSRTESSGCHISFESVSLACGVASGRRGTLFDFVLILLLHTLKLKPLFMPSLLVWGKGRGKKDKRITLLLLLSPESLFQSNPPPSSIPLFHPPDSWNHVLSYLGLLPEFLSIDLLHLDLCVGLGVHGALNIRPIEKEQRETGSGRLHPFVKDPWHSSVPSKSYSTPPPCNQQGQTRHSVIFLFHTHHITYCTPLPGYELY